jgi:hypothetical protein
VPQEREVKNPQRDSAEHDEQQQTVARKLAVFGSQFGLRLAGEDEGFSVFGFADDVDRVRACFRMQSAKW